MLDLVDSILLAVMVLGLFYSYGEWRFYAGGLKALDEVKEIYMSMSRNDNARIAILTIENERLRKAHDELAVCIRNTPQT